MSCHVDVDNADVLFIVVIGRAMAATTAEEVACVCRRNKVLATTAEEEEIIVIFFIFRILYRYTIILNLVLHCTINIYSMKSNSYKYSTVLCLIS